MPKRCAAAARHKRVCMSRHDAVSFSASACKNAVPMQLQNEEKGSGRGDARPQPKLLSKRSYEGKQAAS